MGGAQLSIVEPVNSNKRNRVMDNRIDVLMEPLTEADVLAETMSDANPTDVAATLETKALCCVDHLCGCAN